MNQIIRLQVMHEPDLLAKAVLLVNELFKDKFDKEGVAYINHLYYVRDNVQSLDEKIVGLLHDTIEDTDVTFEDLEELGFTNPIIDSLRLLTRDKIITYSEYIDNILNSGNMTAIRVKKVDMMHNMKRDRLDRLSELQRHKLINKYTPEYEKLENYLKER